MKITIESTDHVVDLNGARTRLWRGTTETGGSCEVLVAGIATDDPATADQFDRELEFIGMGSDPNVVDEIDFVDGPEAN